MVAEGRKRLSLLDPGATLGLSGAALALAATFLVTLTFAPVEVEAVNINGSWSPWSQIQTPCIDPHNPVTTLVHCGGGVKKRYRSCTNPTPQGSGLDCVGPNSDDHECNTHACQLPGDFLWSQWSPCSKICGRGVMKRYTMCGTIRIKSEGVQIGQQPPPGENLGSDPTTTTTTTTTVGVGNTTTTVTTTTSTSTTTTSTTTTTITTTSTTSTTSTSTTTRGVMSMDGNLDAYELEYEEPCTSNQYNESYAVCNTWSLDEEVCERPCASTICPPFAECVDISNSTDPLTECECQLGTKMKEDKSECIVPPPTTPTPRPIPTLPPEQKVVSNVMTKGASTILIICVGICLGIFLFLRILDPSRVIHMNMEIALLLAHICMLPAPYDTNEGMCRVFSILIHFFFTACFVFMLLEAIHMYSLVAWVVHSNGLLTRLQNTAVGWGLAFIIVLFNMCFEYDNYGSSYHCWLQMDTNLMYGQFIPIIVLVVMTFSIVESAGNTDKYERLAETNKQQRLTAQFMQRTLIFILPLIFASFVVGTLAEFEQNLYLYSLFTILNGVIGVVVLLFHCMSNESVRAMISKCFGKKKDKDEEDDGDDEVGSK